MLNKHTNETISAIVHYSLFIIHPILLFLLHKKHKRTILNVRLGLNGRQTVKSPLISINLVYRHSRQTTTYEAPRGFQKECKMTAVQKLNTYITGLFQAIDIRSGHLPDWQKMIDFLLPVLDASHINLILDDASSTHYSSGVLAKSPLDSDATTHIQPLEYGQLVLDYDQETNVITSKALLTLLTPHLNNALKLALQHEQNILEHRWQSLCLSGLKSTALQLSLSGEIIHCHTNHHSISIKGLVEQNKGKIYLPQKNEWVKYQLELFSRETDTAQISQCQLKHNEQRWIASLIYRPSTNQHWLKTSGQVTLLLTPIEIDNQSWQSDSAPMTEAEARIITLFANGHSAEEVAKLTDYRVNTVYSYVKKFYKALGINKQSQLTATVWRQML